MRFFLFGLLAALTIATVSPAPTLAQATPEFKLGFQTLASLIPDIVGQPVENEHFNPQTGDSLQTTTTGLMVWRKADNFTAFTDGSTTWINGPFGLQSRPNNTRFPWEPDAASMPPAPSSDSTPAPLPAAHPDNWSGYSVTRFKTGQDYTSVSGNWTVPAVQPPTGRRSGFSATWVGIGGACLDVACSSVDRTLIQVGTEQDAMSSVAQYSAWYEMLPGPAITIDSLAIHPGDRISASVQMVGGARGAPQTWRLSITNATTGQSWSRTVGYTSSLASAEWIMEAPFSGTVLPLANFGTLTLGPTAANGANPRLAVSDGIVMLNPRGQTANVSTPSASGDAFNVCWGSDTALTPCPVPGS